MDLHFSSFDNAIELPMVSVDLSGMLAVLMVGVTARQAASLTAATQTGLQTENSGQHLLAPLDGAFNGTVAIALTRWKYP